MISISTIFITSKTKVINDYNFVVEDDGESVTATDIEKVDLEIIKELKELYDDDYE